MVVGGSVAILDICSSTICKDFGLKIFGKGILHTATSSGLTPLGKCPCGEEILLPLTKKMKKMEEEARMWRTEDNYMLICLITSWILLIVIVLCIYVRCFKWRVK